MNHSLSILFTITAALFICCSKKQQNLILSDSNSEIFDYQKELTDDMYKIISIYKYNDDIYIIPNYQVKNSPYTLSAEIIKISKAEINEKLIQESILKAVDFCVNLNEGKAENYFNYFLKKSKIKTHKNLINNADLISLSIEKNVFNFELLKLEQKYKAFINYTPRIILAIDSYEEQFSLGKAVINLFSYLKKDKD